MSDQVVGRGTIELVADARQLKAGIEEAKKSIRTLGEGQKDISAAASRSIDQYIGRLEAQNATLGKSTRETEIYKLALRGASNEQINAANSTLKVTEAHEQWQTVGAKVNSMLMASSIAASAAAIGFAAMAHSSIESVAHMWDLSKSTGESIANLTGLNLLAREGGMDIDSLGKAVNKMTVEMGKSPEKFTALGVTATDSIGALKQISDVFISLTDVQQRNALAQKVFGRNWSEVADVLSMGSEKIGQIVERGKQLSGITDENAQQAKKLKDQLAELNTVMDASRAKIALGMTPALIDASRAITQAWEEAGKLKAVWVGLGAVGALLFTDEFSSNTVKLKNLTAELKSLESAKQGGFGTEDLKKFAAQADEVRAKIEAVKKAMAPPEALPAMTPAGFAYQAMMAAMANARAAAFIGTGREARAAAPGEDPNAALITSLEKKRDIEKETTEVEKLMFYLDHMRADLYAELTTATLVNAESIAYALDLKKKEEVQGKAMLDYSDRLLKIKKEIDVADSKDQDKKTQAIISAHFSEIAATDYLNILRETNAVKLQEMSISDAMASRLAGRLQIEKKYNEEIKTLDNKRTTAEFAGNFGPDAQAKYDDELDRIKRFRATALGEYDVYFAKRRSQEEDWTVGAIKSMENYAEESRNVSKQSETAFTNAFKGMEDAAVNFVKTGKLDFKSLADSIITDIIRIQMRQNITGPLSASISNIFASGVSNQGSAGQWSANDVSAWTDFPGFASGTPYVSKTGLAVIHQGEAIVPAAQNAKRGDTYVIDARGADAAGLARLENMIKTLNGSIEKRAVGAVINDLRRHGPTRTAI